MGFLAKKSIVTIRIVGSSVGEAHQARFSLAPPLAPPAVRSQGRVQPAGHEAHLLPRNAIVTPVPRDYHVGNCS
jgi:hypothetical protein